MPTKKTAKKVAKKAAGAKRGPKEKADKKRPIQVYMLESEIMKIGQFISPKNKTYAQCIEAVRIHTLGLLYNNKAIEP